MKRSWISLAVCLFCLSNIGAVLYAGAEGMDSGGGWISFSPGLDVLFWGTLAALSGVLSAIFFAVCRPGIPKVPAPLQFPAAYVAVLGILTVGTVLLGACGLFPSYDSLLDLPVHIPFWLYAILLCLVYLSAGYWFGCRSTAGLHVGVCWGIGITAVLVLLGIAALLQRWNHLQPFYGDMVRQWQESGFNGCGFVDSVMETVPGAILARINLPASVLMGAYDWDYVDLFRLIERNPAETLLWERIITVLVCACPSLLFTIGWAIGSWRGT